MWTKNIFPSVYSRIVANGKIHIKEVYPSMNPIFTDNTPSAEKIKYPCIVIKKLSGMEVGKDIEGRFVNGIMSNIQIEVFTNTKQNECDDIAEILVDVMKALSYEMVGEPTPMEGMLNDYRNISIYRREIDYQDII